MLDRMSLSIKNGWFDEQNRAYIVYSIENMMDDLGGSKPTCVKIVKELDSEKGIGLIEKKRRGMQHLFLIGENTMKKMEKL